MICKKSHMEDPFVPLTSFNFTILLEKLLSMTKNDLFFIKVPCYYSECYYSLDICFVLSFKMKERGKQESGKCFCYLE